MGLFKKEQRYSDLSGRNLLMSANKDLTFRGSKWRLLDNDKVFRNHFGTMVPDYNERFYFLKEFVKLLTLKNVFISLLVIMFLLGGLYIKPVEISLRFSRDISFTYSEEDRYSDDFSSYTINFPFDSNTTSYLDVDEITSGFSENMTWDYSNNFDGYLQVDDDNILLDSDDFTSHSSADGYVTSDLTPSWSSQDTLILHHESNGGGIESRVKPFDCAEDEYIYHLDMKIIHENSNPDSLIILQSTNSHHMFIIRIWSTYFAVSKITSGTYWNYYKQIDFGVPLDDSRFQVNIRWVNRSGTTDNFYYDVCFNDYPQHSFSDLLENYVYYPSENPSRLQFYSSVPTYDQDFYIYSWFAEKTLSPYNISETYSNSDSLFSNVTYLDYDINPLQNLTSFELTGLSGGTNRSGGIDMEIDNGTETFEIDQSDILYLSGGIYNNETSKAIRTYDFLPTTRYNNSRGNLGYFFIQKSIIATYNVQTNNSEFYINVTSNRVEEQSDGTLFVDTSQDSLCNVTIFVDSSLTAIKTKTFRIHSYNFYIVYDCNMSEPLYTDIELLTSGYSFVSYETDSTSTSIEYSETIYITKDNNWWVILCINIFSIVFLVTNPIFAVIAFIFIFFMMLKNS